MHLGTLTYTMSKFFPFKDSRFSTIVRNLPQRIAPYCNILSSKAQFANPANNSILTPHYENTPFQIYRKFHLQTEKF